MKKAQQDSLQTVLTELIANANLTTTPESVGTVVSFGDGVMQVNGLSDVQAGELVDLGENEFGLALNLTKETTGVVALGKADHVTAGSLVKRTGQILSIGVADSILGRVVDTLGRPLDGGPAIKAKK